MGLSAKQRDAPDTSGRLVSFQVYVTKLGKVEGEGKAGEGVTGGGEGVMGGGGGGRTGGGSRPSNSPGFLG